MSRLLLGLELDNARSSQHIVGRWLDKTTSFRGQNVKRINIIAFTALLILPAGLKGQEAQGYAPSSEATADIIETAKAAGSFNTLAKAIEAAA